MKKHGLEITHRSMVGKGKDQKQSNRPLAESTPVPPLGETEHPRLERRGAASVGSRGDTLGLC